MEQKFVSFKCVIAPRVKMVLNEPSNNCPNSNYKEDYINYIITEILKYGFRITKKSVHHIPSVKYNPKFWDFCDKAIKCLVFFKEVDYLRSIVRCCDYRRRLNDIKTLPTVVTLSTKELYRARRKDL